MSARKLRRRAADINAFANALHELLQLFESNEWTTEGGHPLLRPRSGSEADAARAAGEVDLLAGAAALGIAEGAGLVAWKPPGTWQTQPVNPVSAWRTIFEDYPMFGPDVISSSCAQAIGVLEARAVDAEEDEKRPRRMRTGASTSAGGSGHPYGTIVLSSILGVAGTLVTAYVIYRFGWSN